MTDSHNLLGLSIDPGVRALVLVEERLKNMEAHAQERAQAAALMEERMNARDEASRLQMGALANQVNDLRTDMAVLKSQHESFWKGAAVLFGALSLIGGAIGFVVSQAVQWFHHG